MKNCLVTNTSPPLAALRDTASTNVVIKNEDPISEATYKFSPSSLPPAAIAANTSGAPLPKASKVTPASDSEH